ncbi:PadR family transcriptional regulator [Gaopeijia maritima]|uniref:PadR family transcriptional regulator n=1 Tax=Gaopeijia maritima TaxID=3119007 RepID=A0ABU9E7K2_9BACT
MPLGDLQYLTLLAVARLGARAVAATVRAELAAVADRDVAVSTAFVTLTRLEDRGLLTSTRGDRPERGGRAVRIFSLTEAGWDELRATRAASERMWEGVDPA